VFISMTTASENNLAEAGHLGIVKESRVPAIDSSHRWLMVLSGVFRGLDSVPHRVRT
jgi:hypothetical protein